MVGKQVALMVNFIGENPETENQLRSGEVKFQTLRSFDGLHGISVSIPKGTTSEITLMGTVDTGTDDKFSVLDAAFTCDTIDSTGIVSASLIGRNDPTYTGGDYCSNHHQAYITVRATAAADADGTLVLSNCRTLDEFTF